MPRFGVIMNPYTNSSTVVRQLFVSEPFHNTIAVVSLVIVGNAPNQVFGLGTIARIGRVGQSCAGAGPDRTKDKTEAIKDNTVRIKACYWVS